MLSPEPVLHFPNLGEPFVVEVDASNYAIRGVLLQWGIDNKLNPVAYFSTALQSTQQNWSATSKEAFCLDTRRLALACLFSRSTISIEFRS